MDAFYSGSSDVTLPPRGERAEVNLSAARAASDPEVGGPHFCERCDQSVPSHDLAAGRALAVYGLVFCAACRPAVEAERFEIHFCDACGVSIPLAVVEGGDAVLGDGRLVCVRCRGRPQRFVLRLPLRLRRLAAVLIGALVAGAAILLVALLLRDAAPSAAGTEGPAGAAQLDELQHLVDEEIEGLEQRVGELRAVLAADPSPDRLRRIDESLETLERRAAAECDDLAARLRELE